MFDLWRIDAVCRDAGVKLGQVPLPGPETRGH